MNVYVLEVFQFGWDNKKIISQYMTCDSKESVDELLIQCLTEYDSDNLTLVVNDNDCKIYKVKSPGVEGMTEDSEFFIGWSERHVQTMTDVKEMIENAKAERAKEKIKFEMS